MINLSDQCKMCPDNDRGMTYCYNICGVPSDLLEQIQNDRNERNELLDIVMNSKSEDLIQNLYNWLDEHTSKV